jgi:Fe-S-cluster containining protein
MCCQAYSVVPIQPGDEVPDSMVRHDPATGQLGMTHLGGACIAFDRETRNCTIYAIRPLVCREVQRDDCVCRTARETMMKQSSNK